MDDVRAVTDLLAKASVEQKLEQVSFAGKGLKLDTAEDVKDIVKAIEGSSQVHSLVLNGNTLGVEAAKAIAGALEKRPEFQRAKWFDLFTGRLRSEIPPALRELGAAIITAGANLVELDLSDNAFGPDGVKAVKDLLESKSCYSIQELRFNNNGLGIGGKILAESLIKCHQDSKKAGKPLALKVFIAGRNRLENPGATALAEAFKTIGTLEEIAMPQNGINPDGIKALAEAVEHSPNLRILNLNDNTFTDVGGTVMAKSLEKANKLEVLNFGDCLVRTEGATAIANTLEIGLPALKELNLAFGEIQKVGGIRIAESLEKKKTIEKVDLNGNSFGSEGIEIIKSTLDAFGILETLQSLSDDEECSDDDEEDDNDDDEGEERDDPELQVRGQAITPSPRNDADGDGDKENVNTTTEDLTETLDKLKL